jgi:hypothetical protein
MITTRQTLDIHVRNRRRMIANGWSKRTDYKAMIQSCEVAEQFLIENPHANDDRVVEWCRAHHAHINNIVPEKLVNVRKTLFGR